MAIDVEKAKRRAAKYKEDKEKLDSGFTKTKYFGVPPDEYRIPYVCPPHKAMQGLPWHEQMVHKREIPIDLKGQGIPFDIRCQRDDFEAKSDSCPPCKESAQIRKERYEEFKKAKNEAQKEKIKKKYAASLERVTAKRKPLSQVIDVTPFYDESLSVVKKVPKCFLDHGKHDKCGKKCKFNAVCEAGIQRYNMTIGVWEELMQHVKDEGDISLPSGALPIRVMRTGSTVKNTRYTTKIVKDKLVFPEKVAKRILSKIEDLTVVDKKPQGTFKELKKIYNDFINFADVDKDDSEDGELPDCYQDYDEHKKKKRGCKKCAVRESCIEIGEEDSKPKSKTKMTKMRKKLKEKSKKGKMNK